MSGKQENLSQRAASVAARFHNGQLRKDGRTSYIAHPFRVAMTVRDTFGVDDPIALAGDEPQMKTAVREVELLLGKRGEEGAAGRRERRARNTCRRTGRRSRSFARFA